MNTDWETLAADDSGNLWIGDTGDYYRKDDPGLPPGEAAGQMRDRNNTSEPDVRLYRVPEPNPYTDTTAAVTKDAAYLFPDGETYNSEAIFWLDGWMFLITKEAPYKLYRFPTYISHTQSANLLRYVGEITASIDPITGADVNTTNTRVALTTSAKRLVVFIGPGGTPTSSATAEDIAEDLLIGQEPAWHYYYRSAGALEADGILDIQRPAGSFSDQERQTTMQVEGVAFNGTDVAMISEFGKHVIYTPETDPTPYSGWSQRTGPGDVPAAGGPFVYAALGDSFASGEGTSEFINTTVTDYENSLNYPAGIIGDNTLARFTPDGSNESPNACHRSLVNYAKINADLFEPAAPVSYLTDRTCSGAQIDPDDPESPPITELDVPLAGDRDGSQAEQVLYELGQQNLSGADVDLVTVSMGGNDSGFSDLIKACLASRAASQAIEDTIDEESEILTALVRVLISNYLTTCEQIDDALFNTADLRADFAANQLPSGHSDLATAFPNATIYQVNYPMFLPAPEDFPADGYCSAIDKRDANYARAIASELNGIIATGVAAADAAYSNSFEVVDISHQFGANPLCPLDPADLLINPIEDGIMQRIQERLLDPTREPGIFLAHSDRDLTACLEFWNLGRDCDLGLSGPKDFALWIKNNLEVIQGYLATVDPAVPLESQDDAAFENFRGLFHPNSAGHEIIACAVRAEYADEDASTCRTDSQQQFDIMFDGQNQLNPEPVPVDRQEVIPFRFNGWDPNAQIRARIWSDPVDLGTFQADANGLIDGNIQIPASIPAGVHRVRFEGTAATGQFKNVSALVEVAGQPTPGQTYGFFVDGLQPFELATITWMGQDFGQVQADDLGHAYIGIPIPEEAVNTTIDLVLDGETTPPVTAPVAAVEHVDLCNTLTPTISGTAGNDTITGTSGDDVIFAGDGDDTITR